MVGDTDPVVRIAWGVATTVARRGVVAGVMAAGAGAGWVQPQTSTRSTARVKITTLLFIMRSQASRNKIMPCAIPGKTVVSNRGQIHHQIQGSELGAGKGIGRIVTVISLKDSLNSST